ncbi:glycosyltransferase family 4 protein [Candidatus Parcubacteria bacterium]|nr:glycosyltransferase family 4 protein [Candidatus Parcubacteria bacterium]
MKKLTIVQIAPLEEPVPPKKYGGTELVVYNLTEELVKRGHKVYLIASGDSETSAKLIPIFEKSIQRLGYAKTEKVKEAVRVLGVGKISEALGKIDADIIHNHLGWGFLPVIHFLKTPVVTTLHNSLQSQTQKIVPAAYEKYNYISISQNQRKPLPDLNYVGNAYNGIDINAFEFSEKKGDYFAFLGRTSPEKGTLQAIQIAKAAKVKLKMAARIDKAHQEFFDYEIKPLVDQKQIEFLGEIDHKEKKNFLKNAIALLAPIQWNEPFGLYFTEAMACGTPVLSFRKGSVPEVIKHGETGFIARPRDIKGMVEHVKSLVEMPDEQYISMRHKCRQHVVDNFTISKMVDAYEKIYYKILEKK